MSEKTENKTKNEKIKNFFSKLREKTENIIVATVDFLQEQYLKAKTWTLNKKAFIKDRQTYRRGEDFPSIISIVGATLVIIGQDIKACFKEIKRAIKTDRTERKAIDKEFRNSYE